MKKYISLILAFIILTTSISVYASEDGLVTITEKMDFTKVVGKQVSSVKKLYKKAGFINITLNKLYTDDETIDGNVKYITVDGDEFFSVGDTFSPDVEVVIDYWRKRKNSVTEGVENDYTNEEAAEIIKSRLEAEGMVTDYDIMAMSKDELQTLLNAMNGLYDYSNLSGSYVSTINSLYAFIKSYKKMIDSKDTDMDAYFEALGEMIVYTSSLTNLNNINSDDLTIDEIAYFIDYGIKIIDELEDVGVVNMTEAFDWLSETEL